MARDGAGIKAVGKTSIQISFQFEGKQRRERLKLVPTTANLARAAAHRLLILKAIDEGTFDYSYTFPNSTYHKQIKQNDKLTVQLYLDDWLNEKKPTLRSSTYNGYFKSIRRIKKAIGKILLSELIRQDVSLFAKTLKCRNKTIHNILSPLRKALNDAVQNSLIEQNPIKNWSYKRVELPSTGTKPDPFNAKEQALILAQLEGQSKNIIQFAFWTGLRTSELIALEWADVDWKRRAVRIERAKTDAAITDEPTKTNAGNREVKLLNPALEAINAQKPYTYFKQGKVFENPATDKPWEGSQEIWRNLWQPALKTAQVRHRKLYNTRHTFASMMLTAGEPIVWVSRALGHSSVELTARTYATLIPDALPDAGGKAERMFEGHK